MSSAPIQAGRVLDVNMRLSNVLRTLGYMPAIAIRALAERNFDTLSYHRSSVLKHHGLPGRRKAQRMLAANLRRQVRKIKADTIEDVAGEGYAVGLREQNAAGWGKFLASLEEGASIKANEPMAVPLPGRQPKKFRELLAAGKLTMIGKGLLVQETKGRGNARLGARTILWGKIILKRKQRALLKFYPQWDAVQGKVSARYDRDMELVMTEAGQARLERTLNANAAGRAAAKTEMQRFLAANPGKHREARTAASKVAQQVRKSALAPKGGKP